MWPLCATRAAGRIPIRCVPPEWTFRNPCAAPDQLLWTIVPIGEDISYAGDQEITALYAIVHARVHGFSNDILNEALNPLPEAAA